MRTVKVEYCQAGQAGPIYAVRFMQGDKEIGHWPGYGGLDLSNLIEDWIIRGSRPS